MTIVIRVAAGLILGFVLLTGVASAQTIAGTVRDETGGALPGVTVEARSASGSPSTTATDASGSYQFDRLADGRYQLTFTLINFASLTRRDVIVSSSPVRVDAVLHLSLSADVTVTGKNTFANLADAANPAENLVGIALSASQGAITAQQLDARPIMRTGEVLETVPGVVISQHSGEGKATSPTSASITPKRAAASRRGDRTRSSRRAAACTRRTRSPGRRGCGRSPAFARTHTDSVLTRAIRRTAAACTRASSVRKAGWSSVRSKAPSCTSMPDSVTTATTRAPRRVLTIA
jgi:hypothetical protein